MGLTTVHGSSSELLIALSEAISARGYRTVRGTRAAISDTVAFLLESAEPVHFVVHAKDDGTASLAIRD